MPEEEDIPSMNTLMPFLFAGVAVLVGVASVLRQGLRVVRLF